MQQDVLLPTDIDTLEPELIHAEQKIAWAMKNAFYEVGIELRYIQKRNLYILRSPTFEGYCAQRWEMTPQRAYQLIEASSVVEAMSTIVDNQSTNGLFVDILPEREAHVRPLLKLKSPELQVEVWRRVVEHSDGHNITAKLVEGEVERKLAELKKDWITLEEWAALPQAEQQRILTQYRQSDKQFNRQDSDSIEWACWSWNPVTGCLHGCEYCYARDIANRFYPTGFAPTLHPDRLMAPQNTRLPETAQSIGERTVFVCSMADLFGNWVPQEWIDAVLASVRNAPQWNFLFLTKYPKRLVNIDWPANAWVGTTVDEQKRVDLAQECFKDVSATVKFLSCEPLLEQLRFVYLDVFDWVIIGGRSKSSSLPEFQPEWEWVENLTLQARIAGCKVYWKPNLTVRPREYPG